MARPSKLSAEVREQIALCVSGGASYRAAALSSGIGELLEAVEQAAARAKVRAAAQIAKAAEADWRAAAWFLERRDPETFGPPTARLEHSGPDGGPMTLDALGIDLDRLSDRDLATLQRIFARAQS
jgi:hypothetical protein